MDPSKQTVIITLETLDMLDAAFCDIQQLIEGWRVTTPADEWSYWDDTVRTKAMEAHQRVLDIKAAIKGFL